MSDSLQPHGLQHTRPSCPLPTPRDYSNSCPLSQWCHPTISSSVVPFSSHLQTFPASGSFRMSQLFVSGGQSIEVSASTSVLPMNSGLTSFRMDCLDFLAVQGTLKSLLLHQISKASVLQCSAFFIVQLSHPYMTTGKTISLTRWTFVGKVMSLLFNMLSCKPNSLIEGNGSMCQTKLIVLLLVFSEDTSSSVRYFCLLAKGVANIVA